jgi:hypothetical protein
MPEPANLFETRVQQVVLDLFAYSLHQSRGYLFLGKAGNRAPDEGIVELVNKKWKSTGASVDHLLFHCLSLRFSLVATAIPRVNRGARASLRMPSFSVIGHRQRSISTNCAA